MSVHIVVTHTTHQTTFYDVPEDQGWKVDPAMRCLVIGRGVPRAYVPLDSVLCFELEPCRTAPAVPTHTGSEEPRGATPCH